MERLSLKEENIKIGEFIKRTKLLCNLRYKKSF